jgi:hypothetical protein
MAENEVLPEYIMGKRAGSREEVRLAIAFQRWNVAFNYQVNYFGGRMLPGGQVVDFITYHPFEQATQVYGSYWHTGQLGSDDRLKLEYIRSVSLEMPPKVFWGWQLTSIEEAITLVQREYF